MKNIFKNKIILVTGGTGSIGSSIVRQLLAYGPKQVRVLSRNETRQYELWEALDYPDNLRMFIGDIRDRDRLQLAFRNVDIVFHAAALKHVPFCEYNPTEAMKTNIVGSHNVIDAAVHAGVKKVIAISTDKVANPFNVLGVSKLMMEKLFINSDFITGDDIKFSCVRFGNVAWSDGSVLPFWKRQAEKKGSINVMNGKSTRFFMSIDQAVGLTLQAAELSQGADIFVLKMPAISLTDLTKIFIKKYYPKAKIKEVDSRPGDKLHEDLIGVNEWNREIWSNQKMFVLLAATSIYNQAERPKKYFGVKYPGFKLVTGALSYSSQENIDTDAVVKII